MQDQLRFTAQRRGDHVAVVCTGWDRAGQAVDFELDAETFKINSRRQIDWVSDVNAVNNLMRTLIKIGVSADRAWEMLEHTLPEPMRLGTGWNSSEAVHQGVADGGQQPLERFDDVGGQSGDGDR